MDRIYKISLFTIDISCDKNGLNNGGEHQITEIETLYSDCVKDVLKQLKYKYSKYDDISEDGEELYWDSTVEQYRDDNDDIAYYSSEMRAVLYQEERTTMKIENFLKQLDKTVGG